MNLPLQKLKVLDFSTLVPGPYASMLMADMGAEDGQTTSDGAS